MSSYQVTAGEGPEKLYCEVVFMGEDITIMVHGGKSHTGSIAVAVPRPSLDNPEEISATTSVFNLPGHKDEHIAQPLAHNISSHTGRVVTVAAGFHLDNISQEQIKKVLNNLDILQKKIYKLVK
ncbi:MAG: hypothetical protein K9L17_04840 [Clostridiales bacterium]|nr:hypothetical protein [Clostridiales bacterium]MCF8022000.1 hypothetical protein [Clostridiales bacterium]